MRDDPRQGSPRRARRRERRESARRRGVAPAARPSAATSAIDGLAAAARFVVPIGLVAAGAAMLAWTWRTWPDAVVDFGREVYLASRLAGGATLYVDVAHFSGPLSPYLNALWFRLFGPGILTLALCNAALAAGFVALLYAVLRRVGGPFAASVACFVFVTLFACAQFTRIGNYNWVTPYSHELPHGVILTVAAFWCLARAHETGRIGWTVAAGVATGVVVLTKAEVLFATTLGIATTVLLALVAERPGAARAGRLVAAFAGGVALPLAITFLWFARTMPAADVLAWPLGHWRAAAMPRFYDSTFYRHTMGTEDVGASVALIATVTFWYAVAFAVAVAGGWVVRRAGMSERALAVAAFVATVPAMLGLVSMDGWLAAPRPLPIVMAILAGVATVGVVRGRADRERAFGRALEAGLAVFALVLLAKIVLYARIVHYGFVLAMPATMLLVVALVARMPAAAARWDVSGMFVRAVALGALVACVYAHLRFMAPLLAVKTTVVGEGRDAIYADARGGPIRLLLREIAARVGPDQTLVLLPEGAIVSYLAHRRNPTPYYLFDGTSLALWGEDNVRASLEAAAPDWIAFVDRGRSARSRWSPERRSENPLYEWVLANYRVVWRLGQPFQGRDEVSATLWQRANGS